MKARKVTGLDADGTLADNARRIVAVRLGELTSFADAARNPDAVTELHDMRIAAKRLRYILELTTPVFGSAAKSGAKQAKMLQDLLGEIHDCDEAVPLIEGHVDRLRGEDVAAVRRAGGDAADDLEPGAAASAPNRRAYRGLAALETFMRARRAVLYQRFAREWGRLERERFADTLLAGLRPD
jgi:CHAD domain-containing protein